MPEFRIPNSASLHAARSFLRSNDFFGKPERKAILKLHPKWMHLEPYALAMAASWGVACRREGLKIAIRNMGPRAKYAARMKLFDHLGVEHGFEITEHEESGRFLPVRNVRNPADIQSVIADISAMLHLQARPDALAAVQYCISELLRNAIEHSGSPDGAFVCAHNYDQGQNRRVSVAVADCGSGIPAHLGRSYPEANADALVALHLAMLPGITGVIPGMYGTPDNAGAGLFITRQIARSSGGYFLIASGDAVYRLRRGDRVNRELLPMIDPFDERHDQWKLPAPWKGTVVAVEIRTDHVDEFKDLFGAIRRQIPRPTTTRRKIRFT